jgi:hypothetical protein
MWFLKTEISINVDNYNRMAYNQAVHEHKKVFIIYPANLKSDNIIRHFLQIRIL